MFKIVFAEQRANASQDMQNLGHLGFTRRFIIVPTFFLEDLHMELPPIPPSPQIEILGEARRTNEYFAVLIEMFARQFPESMTDELLKRLEETAAM